MRRKLSIGSPAVTLTPGQRVSRRTGKYTVLVPVGLPESGPALLSLARSLVPEGQEPDLRPLHVATREPWRGAADSASDALGPLLAAAADEDVRAEPITRRGPDVATEIAAVAEELDARLIVLGWQRPSLSRKLIGSTVATVMARTKGTVAVLYDRQPRPWARLLVPYLHGPHDLAAVGAAQRLGAEAERVTILHVVEPDEDPLVIGPFRESFQDPQSEVKVVPAADPLAAAVDEARDGGYDAIVVGTSRAWAMSPNFLGLRHEQLARETEASLVIVRAAGS